jgi:DsbE subfamily thiol:disulfide oxidoreductase
VVVATVMVGAVACTSGGNEGDSVTGVRAVADPLPMLSGTDLQGKQLSTQDLGATALVINAWATWCAPCEQEQPALVDVAERYANRGVTFLGINHADQDAKALEWVRHYGVPYRSLSDPAGRFAATMGYIGLPDTYVVDGSGTIRYVIAGPTDAAQLSGLLDQVLAAQASASSATAANSPAK